MKKSQSTKKSLTASIISLVTCIAMLIGTTFAWFTDTASTAVNKIQSGNLDVALMMKGADENWITAEGQTLTFKTVDNRTADKILWEPGCTYELPELKVVNNGNLALKYKIEITGIKGDAELNDVIEWTISDTALDTDHSLAAGAASEPLTIKGHMKETAGNEYQDKKIEGIGVTVYATQDTVESDSNDNQYDKDAEYATPVSSDSELKDAVGEGKNVVLEKDITTTAPLAISSGNEVSIDLNGKTVTANKGFATVTNNSKLTLTGGTVTSDSKSIVNVSSAGEVVVDGGTYKATGGQIAFYAENNGKITVNNGAFTANEFVCSPQKGGELIINGGTFTALDNAVIATNGSSGNGKNTITINGGTFNGNIKTPGYIACGVYVANNDTVNINAGTFNITDGVGILMRAGNTTIGKDVEINLTNTGTITEGKVGDAKINISTPSYLVEDVRSGYPGSGNGFTITNNSKYELVEYK